MGKLSKINGIEEVWGSNPHGSNDLQLIVLVENVRFALFGSLYENETRRACLLFPLHRRPTLITQ